MLASGGIPVQLKVAGAKEYARTLRTPEDAEAIIKLAKPGSEAAVIGSSFIGMEVASSLTQRKLRTTIVTPEEVPFEKKLGKPIGGLLQRLHERNGVQFRLQTSVSRITSRQGKVELILENGGSLQADLLVVRVGVRPATSYLRNIELNPNGGVLVNEYFQVPGKPGLFAAGDIAAFPVPPTGEIARIEHWRVAQEQGRIAALNMMGQPTPYAGIPYFWTSQFDIRFDYVGHAERWDEIIVNGDLDKPDFIAFYISKGWAIAATAAKRDKQAAAFLELVRRGPGCASRLPEVRLARFDRIALVEAEMIAKSQASVVCSKVEALRPSGTNKISYRITIRSLMYAKLCRHFANHRDHCQSFQIVVEA